jgi:hypothetical protein
MTDGMGMDAIHLVQLPVWGPLWSGESQIQLVGLHDQYFESASDRTRWTVSAKSPRDEQVLFNPGRSEDWRGDIRGALLALCPKE